MPVGWVERQRNPSTIAPRRQAPMGFAEFTIGPAKGGSTHPTGSLQMKLAELAVLCPNPTHRAGDRPHHDGVGLDQSLTKSNPLEHRPGGDSRRSEKTVSRHQVFHLVFLARILDAHFGGARALLFSVEHQPALELAADAGERCRREHAFGCAADPEV